jgi:hypothetical protein
LLIPLTHIPLNTHSKIDVHALSTILEGISRTEERPFALEHSDFEPLQTEEEVIIGQAISQELGIEVVDINRNEGFAQLGGDSVKAMSVVAILHRMAKHVSIQQIMLSQSLKDLASLLAPLEEPQGHQVIPALYSMISTERRSKLRRQASQTCGIVEEAIKDIFPCSALQEGFLAVSSRDVYANSARYVFKLGPSMNVEKLSAAWETTVSTISTLQTRFFMSAPEGLLQTIVSPDVAVPRYLNVNYYLESDKAQPFELGDPMFRACIAIEQSGNEELRYFILTIHHAIIDLSTLRLIVETFRAAYQNQPLPSTLLFTIALPELRETTDIVSNRISWKAEPKHSPTPLWPRPMPISSLTSGTKWSRCSRLLSVPRPLHSNKTLLTYVQAAWVLLLSAFEGQDDIIYGIVVSGRESRRCDASESLVLC